MPVKKPRKLSDNQKIIIRLVADMANCHNPMMWGREGRLCKKMIEEYGLEFMYWLPLPSEYKLGSMMWFFEPVGINYLKEMQFKFKAHKTDVTPQKQEIVLQPDKIGEDVIIKKEPKTLKDFLKLYE